MNLNELQQTLTLVKKGQFTKATWQSEKNVNGVQCKKVSKGVVRLVKYANIKGVEIKGKNNANETATIENVLYYNEKTNNYLVQLATTNVKAHCTYYLNGEQVSQEEYELINKPRTSNGKKLIFRVKLENLIALGN